MDILWLSTESKTKLLKNSLSTRTPEALLVGRVGGEDPLVVGAGPEPSVDVDGLKMGGIATLALEVALATGGVDRADVV